MNNQPLFSCNQINFYIQQSHILKNISVAFYEDEIVGLIGPASSGKTSLLKIIAGLHSCYSGAITFTHNKSHSKIGMSFQNDALYDFTNVFGNAAFPLKQKHGSLSLEQKEYVTNILEQVGLLEAQHLQPKELSGGMQKRLGIARALISQPQILLCDDPTAGLDPVTSKHIFQLITSKSREDKLSTIIVSSDIDVLLPFIDRMIFLEEGCKIFDGKPEALQKEKYTQVWKFLYANRISSVA